MLVLIQLVLYIIYNHKKSAIAARKIEIALPVIIGLIDVLVCCIICNIIYEGRKVNLVINNESSVQFIRVEQDDSSDDSSDCSIEF